MQIHPTCKMTNNEILSISPSGLDVYIGCPRRYHYKYTAKISEPEMIERTGLRWLEPDERGTMIHRAVELYVINSILPYSSKLDTLEADRGSVGENKIISLLDAITFSEDDFQIVWRQAIDEIEIDRQRRSIEAIAVPVSAKEKELSEAEKDCRNAIIYLIDKMKERKQYPVKVEMKFGRYRDLDGEELFVEKDGEEKIAICGSIDRVDYDVATGKYVVVDYKTGKIDKKRKLRDGKRDDLLQDKIYTMAFEKLNPGKEVMASRYIFPAEANQEIFAEMTTNSKVAFEDRLWTEIRNIRAKLDTCCRGNKDEYPDCDATCKYCGYAELCKANDELLVNHSNII